MYVIGTAGHIDHGKSLLVEALTGIDPDRLREEKARGMTIDLGFAWLTLPDGRIVSIVDVPGHERFIKNMLAGAGGIDVALLVVAADDGVMPQTREHLAILHLLGVTRGVVALSKRDLVAGDWLALVANDIEDALAGTTLEGSPIVPCSAITGEGLDDLTAALSVAIDALPPKRDLGRPRLPIDRVFTIGGFGTVVTGTLIDGELATGSEIEAVPGGLRGRIRGLQSHKDDVERALPGTRTAVNVSGIDKHALRRGMVLTLPGTLRTTDVIDARIEHVPRTGWAIRHNMHVTFHSYSEESNAVVRLLETAALRSDRAAWAQIKLENPVAVVRGDRFILRTPNDTLAGGIVADTEAKRHRRGDRAVIDSLEALLSDQPERVVRECVRRAALTTRSELALRAAMEGEIIDRALTALADDGSIIMLGEGDSKLVLTSSHLSDRRGEASSLVGAFHREHPLRAGMPQEELRERLGIDALALTALAPCLTDLRFEGAIVRAADFERTIKPAEQAQIDAWLAALRASPASPPLNASIEPGLRTYLIECGAVVDAGDGIVFEAAAFDELTERVRAYIGEHGAITIAQARDLVATSRKYAQALLEHLDRLKVTRRAGEEHVLR